MVEVCPTHIMRTWYRACTLDLTDLPRLPTVPTTTPQTSWDMDTHAQSVQRDVSNAKYCQSIHMLSHIVVS